MSEQDSAPTSGANPFSVEDELYERLGELATEVVALVVEKRKDYGTANINMTGRPGLATRMVDKTARLYNLATAEERPRFETYRDTLLDLVGYGLIGLFLEEHGEW